MQADKEGENLSVTEREFNSESIGKKRFKTVSYTHLTLPTIA